MEAGDDQFGHPQDREMARSQGVDSIARGEYVEGEEQEAREDPGKGASERKGSGGLSHLPLAHTYSFWLLTPP